MKKLNFVLIGLSFLFLSSISIVFGQTEDLSEVNNLKNGRLTTTDGFLINFSKIKVEGTQLHYQESGRTFFQKVELDKIMKVEKQSGSYAGWGGLLLGGSALVGSLYGIAQAASDPFTEIDKSKARNLVIGFTAGGILIGALIGSGIKKYETVYDNPNFDFSSLRFNVKWHDQLATTLFGLNYTF